MGDINKMLTMDFEDKGLWDDSTGFMTQKDVLPDGRTLKSELWGEYGYTFLTYKFPVAGLEDLSKPEIVDYLISQGIAIDLEKYPVEKMQLLTNFNFSDQYDLTITIAENED